jgi:hypothetical protein
LYVCICPACESMACNRLALAPYQNCISTKAGTFTNLPHCGKVVSTRKWDVAVSAANVAEWCQPSL